MLELSVLFTGITFSVWACDISSLWRNEGNLQGQSLASNRRGSLILGTTFCMHVLTLQNDNLDHFDLYYISWELELEMVY